MFETLILFTVLQELLLYVVSSLLFYIIPYSSEYTVCILVSTLNKLTRGAGANPVQLVYMHM